MRQRRERTPKPQFFMSVAIHRKNLGRGLLRLGKKTIICLLSPSSPSPSPSPSLLHSSPRRFNRSLSQSQSPCSWLTHYYNYPLQPVARPTKPRPLQQKPLLLPALSGIYRRPFSCTSATTHASSSDSRKQSIVMPEWSAEKVRETFIGYFKENGHTFGLLVMSVVSWQRC
jgi:hypothetical protein